MFSWFKKKTPDPVPVPSGFPPYCEVNQAIRILNEALRVEPDAMKAIFGNRFALRTEALHFHPSIQVSAESNTLGVIGLINGFFGTKPDTTGYIAAVFTDEGELIKFERV